MNLFSEEYLSHYGIQGQKWGQRNGPPYPLKPSAKSSAEKAAASVDNSRRNSYSVGKRQAGKIMGETGDLFVNNVIVPVAAYAAAVAAIRGIIYAADRIPRTTMANGKTLAKQPGKTESKSESLKKTNPTGDMINCTHCSVAGILRMQGYDVTAQHFDRKSAGSYDKQLKKTFPDAEVHAEEKAGAFAESADKAADQLKAQYGDNAAGVIALRWKGSRNGHAISWTIKDGKVEFLDFQTGRDDADTRKYWTTMGFDPDQDIVHARIDNAEPNMKSIYVMVKNSKKT